MADIGTITGTLELNTERFTGPAREAEETAARLEGTFGELGDSAAKMSDSFEGVPASMTQLTVVGQQVIGVLGETSGALGGMGTALSATSTEAKGAAQSLLTLPPSMQQLRDASLGVGTAEKEMGSAIQVANKSFDEQRDKALALNAALDQMKQAPLGVGAAMRQEAETTAGLNKLRTDSIANAERAALAEQKYGYAMGTATGFVRTATEATRGQTAALATVAGAAEPAAAGLSKIERAAEHIGIHALGMSRSLGTLAADILPSVALGGLAVVGAFGAVEMTLGKAVELAQDWATEGIHSNAEWRRTSDEFQNTMTNSVREVGIIQAKAANDTIGAAQQTANFEIAKANQVRDAQVSKIGETVAAVKAVGPSLKQFATDIAEVFVRVFAPPDPTQLFGGLAEALDAHQREVVETETKARNQIAQIDAAAVAVERAARAKEQGEIAEALRLRTVAVRNYDNDAAHAEAESVAARLAVNKDFMEKLRTDEAEQLRLIDVRVAAQKASAAVQFAGPDPAVVAQREQVITDIERQAAVDRDRITATSGEAQERQSRKLMETASGIFKELGPGFQKLAEEADISVALGRGADEIKIFREAYKQLAAEGKMSSTDFVRGVDEIKLSLVRQGASWEQVGRIVDEESKRIIQGNKATFGTVVEVKGVFKQAGEEVSRYGVSIEETVAASQQMTPAFQAQATAAEQVTAGYTRIDTAARQAIATADAEAQARNEGAVALDRYGKMTGFFTEQVEAAATSTKTLTTSSESLDQALAGSAARTDETRQGIEGMHVALTATDTSVSKLATSSESLDQALSGTAAAASGAATGLQQQDAAMQAGIESAHVSTTAIQSLGSAYGTAGNLITNYNDDVMQLSTGYAKVTSEAGKYQKVLGDTGKTYDAAIEASDTLKTSYEGQKTALDGGATALDAQKTALGSVSGALDQTIQKVDDLTGAYERAAAAAQKLDDISHGHSLDTSLLSVGSAAETAAGKVDRYTGSLTSASGSTTSLIGALGNLASVSGSTGSALGSLGTAGDGLTSVLGAVNAAAGNASSGMGQLASAAASTETAVGNALNGIDADLAAFSKAIAQMGTDTAGVVSASQAAAAAASSSVSGASAAGGGGGGQRANPTGVTPYETNQLFTVLRPYTAYGFQSSADVAAAIAAAVAKGQNPYGITTGPYSSLNLYAILDQSLKSEQAAAKAQKDAADYIANLVSPRAVGTMGGAAATQTLAAGPSTGTQGTWDQTAQSVNQAATSTQAAATTLGQTATNTSDASKSLFSAASSLADTAKTGTASAATLNAAAANLQSAAATITTSASAGAVSKGTTSAGTTVQAATSATSAPMAATTSITVHAAAGALVPGIPGESRDVVPALLRPGELVIPPDLVHQLQDALRPAPIQPVPATGPAVSTVNNSTTNQSVSIHLSQSMPDPGELVRYLMPELRRQLARGTV